MSSKAIALTDAFAYNRFMDFIIIFLINVVKIFKYAILIRVILSWTGMDANNRVIRALNDITDPVLKLCKSIIPPFGMIDLSPILAFFALDLAEYGLQKLLM